MSMNNILNGATAAQDADTARVFAEVLNNDLLAIKTLGGRDRFDTDDALRISRILAEYQGIGARKSPYPMKTTRPTAGGIVPRSATPAEAAS